MRAVSDLERRLDALQKLLDRPNINSAELKPGSGIRKMLSPFFDLLDGILRAPLPPLARAIAMGCNLFALMFWIEPVALRLNLVRSVVWVAVRIVSFMAAFGFATMNRMI